ncbi:MAG TPA: TonB-dependent receptor, partial [Bacteroidales bacterium]|nr:TonB-dependent receptor [Bacteroidales bacterium]
MKLRNTILAFLLALLHLAAGHAQNNGVIEGRIYNAKNNEPVEFATVAIYGTSIGSISDLGGKFLFTGLKPGYVQLAVSSVGFETYVTDPVQVTNARKAYIEIPMNEANVKLEEITVKASPFRRSVESPVSLRRIDLVEIEKSPGGNRDISKVIQSYPGVASTPAYRNDVIVRGGGANENRFYLDGVEIPNINHFATQGASGGPVGIINVDFIREVDFYSGAFPADRGNALSSVLEFKMVDGNKDKLKFKGSVGASDLALTLDGPLGEKTSFIASARRSYLKFLFSVIGLPFLPTYNDFQFKTKTRFNEKNELTILGLGAIDQFSLNLDANETDEQKYILGYLPVNEQWTYTIGAVYKHYGDQGYDTWVLSRNHLNNRSYKYQNNIQEDSLKLLDYSSDETETKLRYEHNTDLNNGFRLNYGAGTVYARYFNSTFNRTFLNGSPATIRYKSTLDLFRWGAFGQLSKDLLNDRLTLSLGIRMDASNYSSEMSNMLDQFSPRFSASYMVFNDFYLNFNTGRYYQLPPYTTLGYRDSEGSLVNRQNDLTYISADHYVGGIEWRPNSSSRLTLEGFYKFYHHYPFSVTDSISLSGKGADFGTFGDEEVLSIAKGRAYGVELLYRSKEFFGGNLIVSYTFVRSETQAFRHSLLENGDWIPTAWDNRHLLNILALREFKNNWRVGLKWRFVGGAPYTPYDLLESSYVLAWDARNQGTPDYNLYNNERLGAFHQLDIRIDKEFYLRKITLNFYVD